MRKETIALSSLCYKTKKVNKSTFRLPFKTQRILVLVRGDRGGIRYLSRQYFSFDEHIL